MQFHLLLDAISAYCEFGLFFVASFRRAFFKLLLMQICINSAFIWLFLSRGRITCVGLPKFLNSRWHVPSEVHFNSLILRHLCFKKSIKIKYKFQPLR